MEDQTKYASYNGLNRPALMMGIPFMPLLAISFLAALGGFAAISAFGVVGIVVPILLASPLMVMKILCADDPNALAITKWKLQGYVLRLVEGTTILVLTSGSKKIRKRYAYRSIANQKLSY